MALGRRRGAPRIGDLLEYFDPPDLARQMERHKRAFEAGATTAEHWHDPVTAASGLRVPGPLGDALILRAIAESGGAAVAVEEATLLELADFGTR